MIGAFFIAIGLIIRLLFYHIQTPDFTDSIVPWLHNLSSNPGLTAFRYPFSDYPPLYLYLLKLVAVLPFNQLYAVKTISVVFDIVLGYVAYKIFNKNFTVFSLFLIIPTVLVNSALWGQCDSIYAAFVLLSFYFMLRDRPGLAAVIFGIAISLKLQAIFFLPVLLGYWFAKSSSKFWNYVLVIPLVYFIALLPAWISGGSLLDLLAKYFHQSKEYDALVLSAPSVFAFINENALSNTVQNVLSYLGIAVAGLVALYIMFLMIGLIRNNKFYPRRAAFLGLLSVLVIPFFLPHMHERYFYLADIFAVVFALYKPRYWYVPLCIITASLLSYVPFLSASIPSLAIYKIPEYSLSLLDLAVILALIPMAVRLTKSATISQVDA